MTSEIKKKRMQSKLSLLLLMSFTLGCSPTNNNAHSLSSMNPSPNPITAPGPGDGGSWPAPPGIGITQPDYRPRALSAKEFRSGANTYAPVNIIEENVALEFDVARQQTRGEARLKFKQDVESYPIFLFEGTIGSIKVNGESVSFSRIRTPDTSTTAIAIQKRMRAGDEAEAIVTFTLSSGTSFASGGVAFLTSMADLVAKFVQQYWPTGFEDDSHKLTLKMKVLGGSGEHRLYANGQVSEKGANEWEVVFPEYYSMSSFYVHLTNRSHWVDRFVVRGQARDIPVTVYSTSSSLVQQAKARLPMLFHEMEMDYGPYSHPEFIAYIVSSQGGMEHVGATVTHIDSLGHELLHSWFARGVMPAEGRSGWVDEAIADWRGKGYQRASSLLGRSPTRLATASPFALSTPMNSYQDGRLLMAELDLFFAEQGGLRPLLKTFMNNYRYSHYTTEEFQYFLEKESGRTLEPFFKRYVFGQAGGRATVMTRVDHEPPDHPRPFTDEEIETIR